MSSAYTAPQRAMDARVYLDESVFAEEQERVLASTWQYACHRSEVENPGEYVAYTIGGENLFTVRDADGEVRTFYNVCMHRGHELVEGSGSRRLIVCPYHAWSYNLDGNLRAAPASDDKPGFNADEICLTQVRTEDFNGFLFVNLDENAPTMDETYPEIREALADFLPSIERMRLLERREYVADSNWKVAVENYNECYHCRHVHKSFSQGVVLPDSYTITPEGYALRHRADCAENQYYEIDFEASPNADKYSSFYLWPLFSFQVYPGPVLNTFVWRPESVDSTPFYRDWFSLDGVESETVREVAQEDSDTTVAEDLLLVRSVQKGMSSRGYQPGPLVLDPEMGINSEHTVAAIKAWWQEAMGV